ncbi:uncharacterized protein LOC143287880 [Babylonia areolata]|uniref:uncharacterized protein LOC143287880 n=1 Tax=Babylonia areolata TaxID=304850 RepID=UPI003FD2B307
MSSTQHGAPPEKVHLGWIWCDGSETKIQHCSHSGWGTHRCDPSRAVSILCSEGDLQVRLVGGPNNKEGRVEVRLGDGDWGSVCGYRFDYKDARVVCRQLELGDSGTVLPKTRYPSPPGKVYRLKKVKCHGSELNLGHCTHGGWGDYSCNISKAASIRCYGERPLETTPTPNPLPESNKTSALRKLANSEVTEQTVVETRKALELPEETTAADVVLVAVILHRASRLQDVSQQTATDLLKIVDTVAALNQSVLHESNSVGNTTNRLIVAMEEVADRVTLPAEGAVRLQTNGTVLQVWNLTSAAVPPSSFLGLVLKSDGELVKVTLDSSPLDRHLHADVDTAVLLPWGIGRKIVEASPGHDVRLSASVVTQTSLFQTTSEQTDTADTDTSQAQSTEEKEEEEEGEEEEGEEEKGEEEEEDRRTARARLNSKVISLRVTVDGRPVTDLAQFGQENVTTVFQPLQTLTSKTEAERRERTRCVFWDFAEREGRGAWSTEGCHLERLVAEKTVCQCTRLSTLFAIILTDLYDPGMETIELHEDVLSDITKGGLTVSICGLILTLLAFIFVKKLHKSLPQLALFNLSLALLLSWVAFLAGVRRVGSHVTCMAVAMLLHHLILATFLWTLVQGTVLLCVVLIKGREPLEPPPPSTSTPTRFMLKAGLTAWGLPALPVIIVSAIDVELYRGGDKYCWMSLQPFYYAFLAPVAVIVTIIIIIYVLVAVSLCLRRRRPNTGHGGSGDSAVNGVCASVSCFVVLVLSWVFAFFALEDARLVFQHLFACTTAIQGVVIFIMYPARDPDVRAFLLQSFGVRGGFPTQQQQQQIMIPLHRPETSPNSELEMSPTSGLDMSPTSEQEMSPTSEQEMSPTSELEMPSGSECEEQTASTGDTSFAPSSH